MARTVNKDEVKEKVFLREHYSANDRNFPHRRPPSLWLKSVSTATIVKTRLGSSERVRTRLFTCQISYREGLGMSPSIMGLTAQDPYIQKEHTELYKVLKFRVNWANIEQDTANIYLVVCTLL